MEWFRAYVQFGDVVMVSPGTYKIDEANEYVSKVMRHMSQFPGGTQSCRGWIELSRVGA